MLKQLLIRNIALIDEITIPFMDGLHVLTGETGAGKSIVVDAMNLLLGGRADRDIIRTGCERAYIEGVFDVSADKQAMAFLKDRELELDEDGLLTLSREVTLSGRSVCRVEGIALQAAQYRLLTSTLMDIHGQHDHQMLMDEKFHMRYFDAAGDDAHQLLIKKVEEAWSVYHETLSEYRKLKDESQRRDERMELLRFQEKELKKAKLRVGEDEELTQERALYRNSERIVERLQTAFDAVYDGEQPALEGVRAAMDAMGGVASLDEKYKGLHERLTNLYYELEDVGLSLRDLLQGVPSDPERLDAIEERLDQLRRLSRKYGATCAEMLEKLQEVENEMQRFESMDEQLETMKAKKTEQQKAYDAACDALTASRNDLARRFEKQMEAQLCDLNMAGTRFMVRVETDALAVTADGRDTVAFMIAPNKGEEMKPLAKIASGGELSRVMLAIKSIASKREMIPTSMVFDEIDTGISGRAAQVVAEKMSDIGRHRQVICVTHLQQIAAMAEFQYLVEKNEHDGRTTTAIRLLGDAERVNEIARMLGGVHAQSDSSLLHAQTLLNEASAYRKNREQTEL